MVPGAIPVKAYVVFYFVIPNGIKVVGSVSNVLSNHVNPFHRESFGNKPHTFGTLPIHDSKKRVGF
jgi:hypothetical protein